MTAADERNWREHLASCKRYLGDSQITELLSKSSHQRSGGV